MPKRVVLVGHCGPDSGYLRVVVSKASKDIQVVSADDEASLAHVLSQGVDLVLLNRQLDWGFKATEGVELISQLRASHPQVKLMLVSNYPDAQEAAVRAGALPGFGKRELGSAKVTELLQCALEK